MNYSFAAGTKKHLTTLTAIAWLGSLTMAAPIYAGPNFNGVWLAFAGTGAFGRGNTSALTDSGAARIDAFYAAHDNKVPEQGAYCVPPGMPSTMTGVVGYPIEILQSEQRITMLAEMEMQVRRIYMDGRPIPDDYPPMRMGYSVGHWDGDTLVIETGLLKESLTRQSPRSEQMHIEERVTLVKRADVNVRPNAFIVQKPIDDDVLVLELTVTDPVFYKEPRQATMYYQRIADDSTLEYDCTGDIWLRALEGRSMEEE